jgi:hypothetical protein
LSRRPESRSLVGPPASEALLEVDEIASDEIVSL